MKKLQNKNPVRTLAKSNHWQILYNRAKELNIQIFNNNKEFTIIQLTLLQWLEIYNQLYTELQLKDNDLLTEAVLNDELRTEAYLLWRRENKDSKFDLKDNKQKDNTLGIPSLIFTSRKRNK